MSQLKPSPIYATPSSIDDLLQYIERFPASERTALYTVMGMTWNLCSALIERSADNDEGPEP